MISSTRAHAEPIEEIYRKNIDDFSTLCYDNGYEILCEDRKYCHYFIICFVVRNRLRIELFESRAYLLYTAIIVGTSEMQRNTIDGFRGRK